MNFHRLGLVELYRSDISTAEAFNHNRRMFARISAFVIWSLVAGSGLFWALRLFVHPLAAPLYAVATTRSVALHGDLTHLFGSAPVTVAEAQAVQAPSRFRLVGVMAPKAAAAQSEAGYGLALLAVGCRPAPRRSCRCPTTPRRSNARPALQARKSRYAGLAVSSAQG